MFIKFDYVVISKQEKSWWGLRFCKILCWLDCLCCATLWQVHPKNSKPKIVQIIQSFSSQIYFNNNNKTISGKFRLDVVLLSTYGASFRIKFFVNRKRINQFKDTRSESGLLKMLGRWCSDWNSSDLYILILFFSRFFK